MNSFYFSQIKFNGMIASADEYFTDNGTYKYDPLKINDAHNYCKTRGKIQLNKRLKFHDFNAQFK